ncbi:MAG: carboxypeptidase-like regulatory domain-containing protein, partial [Planctomycetota bacterium]
MKSRFWVGVALLTLAGFIGTAGDVAGQSSTGSMRGVVKDAQGVIPGVTVVLLNEANGTTRETVTNEVGEYSFPAVTPGTFTVRASVPGFKAFERKGQRVSVQASVALDIVLEVGGIEETITVSGQAPTI